ncbi:MAG: flagellar basal body rod protein FlgB [Clostridia bacterium]|nr:flagellar basal body rod protein FlgB [Clostridia bacterium]
MIGDNLTSSIVTKALDGVWQRQKAVSANIANAETPYYKAEKVTFEEELARRVKKLGTGPDVTGKTIREGLGTIKDSEIFNYDDDYITMRLDGNNVDIDQENVDMIKTQIQYMYLVRSMTNMYANLEYAVKGGK